jgi:hypothetical protein
MSFETTLLSELTLQDFFTLMTTFMFMILSLFFMLRFIVNVIIKLVFDVMGWAWKLYSKYRLSKPVEALILPTEE